MIEIPSCDTTVIISCDLKDSNLIWSVRYNFICFDWYNFIQCGTNKTVTILPCLH